MGDPGSPIKAVPDIGLERLKDNHFYRLSKYAFLALWPLVAKRRIPVTPVIPFRPGGRLETRPFGIQNLGPFWNHCLENVPSNRIGYSTTHKTFSWGRVTLFLFHPHRPPSLPQTTQLLLIPLDLQLDKVARALPRRTRTATPRSCSAPYTHPRARGIPGFSSTSVSIKPPTSLLIVE